MEMKEIGLMGEGHMSLFDLPMLKSEYTRYAAIIDNERISFCFLTQLPDVFLVQYPSYSEKLQHQ